MPEGDVGWVGLATSLVLVAVAIGLSLWRRLGLEREMVVATARALVQLLAVGYALQFVIDPEQPIAYSWAWVVGMVLFAAFTVRRRAPEVPDAFGLSLASTTVSTVVSMGVIFGFGIFPAEGRAIVPIGGMMIGNAMKDTVVAGRRIVAEMAENRPEVEARLALGQPWPEASRLYLRRSMRVALTSQVETTKAVGLVFLPGAMTGLILAGVDPLDAVKVQAAIMFLILGAVATNIVVVGTGLARRLFTPDHRLIHLERSAE